MVFPSEYHRSWNVPFFDLQSRRRANFLMSLRCTRAQWQWSLRCIEAWKPRFITYHGSLVPVCWRGNETNWSAEERICLSLLNVSNFTRKTSVALIIRTVLDNSPPCLKRRLLWMFLDLLDYLDWCHVHEHVLRVTLASQLAVLGYWYLRATSDFISCLGVFRFVVSFFINGVLYCQAAHYNALLPHAQPDYGVHFSCPK